MTPQHAPEAMAESISMSRTIDLMSDPAKMVTLLAFTTFPSQEKSSFGEVAARVNELQGVKPVREFSHAMAAGHCLLSLSPAGLVELDTRENPLRPNRPLRVAALSEKGLHDGTAIAGALLTLQLYTPWEGFLEKSLGAKVVPGRDSVRPLFYRALLEKPHSVVELSKAADIVSPAATRQVKSLVDAGIVDQKALCDPANRRFHIADKDYRLNYNTTQAAHAVIIAAMRFRSIKRFEVTGEELLEQACRVCPELSSQDIWHALSRWAACAPYRSDFIQPAYEPKRQKSEVRITDAYRPYLERLLKVRDLLSEDTEEAETFRVRARRDAGEIINTPELVRRVLAYKADDKVISAQKVNWLPIVEDIALSRLVTRDESVDISELHQATMRTLGRSIDFAYFSQRLKESSILEVTQRNVTQHRTKLAKFVSCRVVVFPRNWEDAAACKDKDPELFFPVSSMGISIHQAETARQICETCPVKLPCLKTALDFTPVTGVRGGIWLDQPGSVTPELKARVANVHILPH